MECNCGKSLNYGDKKNVIKSKYEMMEMNQVYVKIKQHFNFVKNCHKEVNLKEIRAENYTSAEDVFSPLNIPKFNTSTMDGYAVNCDFVDIALDLTVCDSIYADKNNLKQATFDFKTNCVYVTTGSVLPSPLNCVIPIEYAEQLENLDESSNKKIKLIENAKELLKDGMFIRQIGSDIKQNELLLQKNDPVSLIDLGTLLSVGIKSIKVYRLPKIGIISTGDELIDYDKDEDEDEDNTFSHQISSNSNFVVDTNRFLLQKVLKEQFPHIDIIDFGIVNDDLISLENTFNKVIASDCDMLLTSGGVSMGEKDLVKKLLESKGEILFGRINMKPGKPTTFGKYKNLTVIALPGNPVSCIVCFYLIVCFSIKCFQNPNQSTNELPYYHPFKLVKAKLIQNVKLDYERPEYSRGVLYYNSDDKSFYVHNTGSQQSSRLKSFSKFNCLMIIPKGSEGFDKMEALKEEVDCLVIKGFNVISKEEFENLKINFENLMLVKANTHTQIETQVVNKSKNKIYSVGSVTISDRAHKGEYNKDESTIALKKYFEQENLLFELKEHTVVPDEKELIRKAFAEYVDKEYNLIVSSGGTGFSSRDVTPEVTKEFVDKEASSLSTYITMESMKITKFACLSRNVVGIKNKSLIINLPGNPKAIKENLDIVKDILPHAINQIVGQQDNH